MEMKTEMEIKWVICPVCHNKTRVKVREDTVIKNFLLYCPKCRQENLINISNFQIDVIE
ncbi:MAG: cysteine-rich KTR domain-containing protein [Lachnospiraceae bacterium]